MKKLLLLFITFVLFGCKTRTSLSKQYEVKDSLDFQEWLYKAQRTISTIEKDTAWQ